MTAVKISDYRYLAQQKISKEIFDFIEGGACDEITRKNNRNAFDKVDIRPFCLRDVATIDSTAKLIGYPIPTPLLLAPTAFHQLVDASGELSTAKAAKSLGIPMVVSSMSNKPLEEIAAQSKHQQLWFQVYIFKERAITEELVRRAEQAGYKAIVLTVGVPFSGKRERDIKNLFSLPKQLTTGNFKSNVNAEVIYDFTAAQLDPSITWRDVEWLKTITPLPLILKGILNPLDAKEACQLNVDGIIVSNHGGRQLDTTEATLLALPDISKAVGGRTMILLDGGIERGTDIFKAIAWGADAVMLGRPVLWALAVDGERGVLTMLSMLISELEMAMKLAGCKTIKAVKDFGPHLRLRNF
ncbi:alpha-hydroxy acid oxidase [Legionella feeleii]|uniref:FMN-dependent dehydrogenase n=1 Tax=Legionella feeleii TaxID=453 RepID=A0A378IP92_9GAMM|nr:alpha-hydroxy acid oxidase [Legionella feeleii]STX37068.1 FMN-dependent dehydrogenase [Legionella feeleii]